MGPQWLNDGCRGQALLLRAEQTDELCIACLSTVRSRICPVRTNPARWARLEAAKRRLVYTLLTVGLPVLSRSIDKGDSFPFVLMPPVVDKLRFVD